MIILNNKKRVIVISHCIINELSKVRSFKKKEYENVSSLIKLILDEGIGIIQLPCPETYIYGLKRWGHVKEQFDNPHFRKQCRVLFETSLIHIKNHIIAGDEILCIAGISGSPSCGVNMTCSSRIWGGELGTNPDIQGTLSDVKKVEGQGVFIETIDEILKENNIEIEMIEYDRNDLKSFNDKIVNLLGK